MDVVVLHGSVDQSFSPYKNPRKMNHPFISRPYGYDHFPTTGLLPQPPLLPLPATALRRSATMYPPVTKKSSNGNRARDSSLTPKKSKYAKKEEKKSPKKAITNPLEADMFSGAAAFATSPPPSSLPLPTFSLRPKMVSCKVEAFAGIDTGATDNLRRLLRLQ